jgi:hypothetical protein
MVMMKLSVKTTKFRTAAMCVIVDSSTVFHDEKSQLRDREEAWRARGPEFKTDTVHLFLGAGLAQAV